MSGARNFLLAGPADGPGLIARRPEIVPVGAAVLAWAVLAAISPASAWTVSGAPNAPDAADAAGAAGHAGHGSVFTWFGVGMIALMAVAMMAPLAIPGARTVASTSLWWRAGRAVGWFCAAFGLSWVLIAMILAPFAAGLGVLLGDPTMAAGLLVLACAGAEFDPRRGDLTTSCDRPMRLRATGSDANSDCARFGMLTACRGWRLCALPMAAMLAVPGSLLLMALITAASVTDRVTLGRRNVLIAAGYVTLGVVLLI